MSAGGQFRDTPLGQLLENGVGQLFDTPWVNYLTCDTETLFKIRWAVV